MFGRSGSQDGPRIDGAAAVNVFLDEYSRNHVITRYLNSGAAEGIVHALAHVYGPIYSDVIDTLIGLRSRQHKFRLLEYGCGGGMNLLKLIELMRQQRVEIDVAVGADFSLRMVEAARREAALHLPPEWDTRVGFVVANNETLARDLARGLSRRLEQLECSFDIVVGVNTFRYCHRLHGENDCAKDIFRLLAPGGYSIMIDMNRRFPLFRSRLTSLFRRRPKAECYLPSLEEYVRPFKLAGFTIAQSRNFCWFPHSAGSRVVAVCRVLAPALDLCCAPFAMRSLVVAQRPV
jgi:SAM-dependent methyltransferase